MSQTQDYIKEDLENMVDDGDYEIIALIVLNDMPIEAINKLLHNNKEHSYAPRLLLAETYDNIPDYDGDGLKGTPPSVNTSWRSPFVGKTVQDTVDWIRSIPKPLKPINKTFCAAMKKDLYEERGKVLICKWVEDAEPQTITYSAGMVGSFAVNFSRGD